MPAARMVPSRELLLMALNELGTQLKAADMFGVHSDLIAQWCRSRSITRHDYKNTRENKEVLSLTKEDASLIRLCKGELTALEVSVKFGITRRKVRRIWRGETWA